MALLFRMEQPLALVEEMVDRIPEHEFQSSTTLFLDPAMGAGDFLYAIAKRLRRHGYSLENICSRLFGVEEDIAYVRRAWWKYPELRGATLAVDPGYITSTGKGKAQSEALVRIMGLQFDVVMGNPPYQPAINRKKQGGSSGSGAKIWHNFVERALELCKFNGHILMVTPNNWRRSGLESRGHHRHVQQVMWSNQILWVKDAKPHFPDIGNSTLIDAWHICKNGKKTQTGYPALDRQLLYPLDRDPQSLSVLEKYFAACSSGELIEAERDRRDAMLVPDQDAAHQYPYVRTSAQLKNSDFWWSAETPKDFAHPKVFFSYSGEYGAKFIDTPLGTNLYFKVKDQVEGGKLQQFINSKFVDFILHKFVQEGNFEVPVGFIWKLPHALLTSDDPLHEVFGLTQEEIDLISKEK